MISRLELMMLHIVQADILPETSWRDVNLCEYIDQNLKDLDVNQVLDRWWWWATKRKRNNICTVIQTFPRESMHTIIWLCEISEQDTSNWKIFKKFVWKSKNKQHQNTHFVFLPMYVSHKRLIMFASFHQFAHSVLVPAAWIGGGASSGRCWSQDTNKSESKWRNHHWTCFFFSSIQLLRLFCARWWGGVMISSEKRDTSSFFPSCAVWLKPDTYV